VLEDGTVMFKPFEETRIMGVLQRISICYFFTALLVRYCTQMTTYIIGAGILLLYWLIIYAFGDAGREFTMEGNAVRKFDIFLLGENHVYKRDAIPFDPEGLLSTIPAIVNVLAGYWTGRFIQVKGKSYECLAGLMVAGIALVALGLWWDLVFPFSKKIWTSSFVLCTVGIDVLMLSMLIYIVEIRQWNIGASFFNVFGKNPLFIYLLSELLYITLCLIKLPSGRSVFEWISIDIFQRIFPGALGSLTTAIAFMMICWTWGLWLDRKRIYIRL
jgi:predicted acyltransferase